MKELKKDIYDDFIGELFFINDENIKNEGDILYEMLYNELLSKNKQFII